MDFGVASNNPDLYISYYIFGSLPDLYHLATTPFLGSNLDVAVANLLTILPMDSGDTKGTIVQEPPLLCIPFRKWPSAQLLKMCPNYPQLLFLRNLIHDWLQSPHVDRSQ
jgi:hypothetical protein